DGDGNGVFAQRYSSASPVTPLGAELWVNRGQAGAQSSPDAQFAADGSFTVVWDGSHQAYARWYSWSAPDETLPLGPWVRTTIPSGSISAAFDHVTVVFDRPIDATTFTAADATLVDPVGRTIAVTSVTTSDDRSFDLNIATQTLAGTYRLKVGPDVRDKSGLLMNQDGDATNGEAADLYQTTFERSFATAAVVPMGEPFELTTIDAIAGYWSFSTDAGSTFVTTADAPRVGAKHLELLGPSTTTTSLRTATIKVDLAAQATANNLSLGFWIKKKGATGNSATLAISGDGASWTNLGSIAPTADNTYAFDALDFDQALDAAGIVRDADVYVRMTHQTDSANSALFVDDLQIGTTDFVGPRITAISPTSLASGASPLDTITVTFNEPLD
ncbi:MAG TPA: Ig-like domain-containing protein, partial [Pirellulaceae bacterium]|nr:Ig-like domain-containing protein [Pirellulaceae bacterium]